MSCLLLSSPYTWHQTSQWRLGPKPSPGGLPPVLPSGKMVPFLDGRSGGSSQWGGTGRRGLRVCGQVGQLLAPRPQVSRPHGGRGQIILGFRCPAGVKEVWAHPGRERAPGPRDSPRENLQPWPQWLQWPPQDPAKGPGPANPGPGSPHVNTFCGHKGREATNAFTEKGVGALGD